MKTSPRLFLACLALSSSLMAGHPIKKPVPPIEEPVPPIEEPAPPIEEPAPPVKKKAGPIIFNVPDLNPAEVGKHLEKHRQITYGPALEPLPNMEPNGDAIESILQNKKTKTTLEKLNTPIVIRSMQDAAKYLSRASMEMIDIDFTEQQLVIFAWKGLGKDKLRGHLRHARALDIRFRYSPATPPANQAGAHPLSKKTFGGHGHAQTAVFATTKGAKVRVQQKPVRFEIIRCGL